nr:GNAT family N-acetyltransferase [uncultured Desulfobacter sp.]
MAQHNSQIKGVLPLVYFNVPLKKKSVSLPYCDAGGVLADDSATETLLLQHALKMCRPAKLVIRSARPFADFSPKKIMNSQKVRMILSLPQNSEELLVSLKAKVRSQVKKAYKNGLSSKLGSLNLLDEFYSVFSENMRDLGSPVHSKRWIKAILKTYGNRAHAAVVYMPDGEPAAAGIILCHPKMVSIPWASSLRRFNRSNPNMMLYWTFLKFASDNGYPTFDFGRSTPDEGTFRFKKQWGAEPSPLYWADLNYTPDPTNNHLCPIPDKDKNGTSTLRAMAESTITKMPISISTAFGSLTRKYITL